MAQTVAGSNHRLLAQAIPAAATLTDLVTVESGKAYRIFRVTATNQLGTATTIRMSIAPAGVADANSQYFVFDLPLAGNDTYCFDFDMPGEWLASGDILRVQSGSGSVSFHANGNSDHT